jgi:hypothetical protein
VCMVKVKRTLTLGKMYSMSLRMGSEEGLLASAPRRRALMLCRTQNDMWVSSSAVITIRALLRLVER